MFLLHRRLSGVDGLADAAQLERSVEGAGVEGETRGETGVLSFGHSIASSLQPEDRHHVKIPESFRAKYRPR